MNAAAEYRRNMIQGKSGIGLVVVLYDALIACMYKGALAMRAGEIEARTEHLNQALRIVGHLRGTLDRKAGGEVAANLDRFYDCIGSEILRASATASCEVLEAQIAQIRSVAAAWKEVENK